MVQQKQTQGGINSASAKNLVRAKDKGYRLHLSFDYHISAKKAIPIKRITEEELLPILEAYLKENDGNIYAAYASMQRDFIREVGNG